MMVEYVAFTGVGIVALIILGIIGMIIKCYHQVSQGTALIRNGMSGAKVSFSGITVLPIIHRVELMDLSVKRVEINRMGKEGLLCKDNMRADLKVAFFVRVNNNPQDVLKVAQSLGCRRASDINALVELFDAKFSEALKTVGKQFDFVDLYTTRKHFKDEIINLIGTDLNGYVLEDAAIDYLEQTPLETLNPNNILDAEGIKKIMNLTSDQAILTNKIKNDREQTIVQQNVQATQAILLMQQKQAETEQKQKREIAAITAREEAEAHKVQQEERLKGERARIISDEEIAKAEENKMREVILARKNKERAEQVETEKVEQDRALQATERELKVALAQIEKNKAVETEQKNIQEVIRQRIQVQRVVAEEEERIKDVREYAAADRAKKVAITQAEQEAEQSLVKEIKQAEASRKSATFAAEQLSIEWEAQLKASEKEAEGKKVMAKAKEVECAAEGLAQAKVMEFKAAALEKEGSAQAMVLEKKALAEAKGMEAKAAASEKQGTVDASIMTMKAQAEAKGIEVRADAMMKQGTTESQVLQMKLLAEAKGIEEKANSMKLLDAVGRGHEEFKLRLSKERDVELAEINISRDIADSRARIVGDALKSAHIEIIGGETTFFDKIVNAVGTGKAIDRMIENSHSLTAVKDTLFSGDPATFQYRLKKLMGQFALNTEDIKNLTVSALLGKLMVNSGDPEHQTLLRSLMDNANQLGLAEKSALTLLTAPKAEAPKSKSDKPA